MSYESQKIKRVIFGIFFMFIIIYGFARSTDLIFGVKIRGVSISDGTTTTESVTRITGNAKNATGLILNGRKIPIDLVGNFNETIALLPGYNIVNLRAEDKFGYIDEKNYKLILKDI